MRAKVSFTTLLVCLAVTGSTSLGQVTTGTIFGTVSDSAGAAIPGATITIRHTETGIRRTISADAAGRYRAPQLALGNYEITAETAGFQTVVRSGITLTVGREAVVDFALQVGAVAESITVTGEAPLVTTQNATLSGLVDERSIRDLPLNGRSFDNLITLSPGAIVHTNRERLLGAGPGNFFSVSGLKPGMNRFTIDGTEYNGAAAVSTTPGGVSGETLGIDAIREFEVLRNVYSSEFGKRGGGQINIVTKSGTNEFHGTVFHFHRNDNLDARNFFDVGQKPEFKRNNFGFVLGGPILRNKTFFFGGYEGFRDRLGLTLVSVVPDDNARQGLLPAPDPQNPGRFIPGQFIDVGLAPSVKPFLVLYPLANGRSFGDGTAESINRGKNTVGEDWSAGRIDHNFSDNDILFGRYTFDDGNALDPDRKTGNPFTGSTLFIQSHVGTIEEKHIFSPTTLNALRFGFNRALLESDEGSIVDWPPEITFVKGNKIGNLAVGAGGARAVAALTLAGNSGAQQNTGRARNQFAVSDQLSHTRGAHALSFGAEAQRIRQNDHLVGSNRGNFQFNGLQELLTGRANTFVNAVLPGETAPTKSWRQTFFSFYVQDNIQMFRNFVLNLGLRYEFLTNIKDTREDGGGLYFLRDATPRGPVVLSTPQIADSPFTVNNSLKSLAPRVGFAWNPFGKGKTSVRAGFGMFYDQLDNLGWFLPRGSHKLITARYTINDPVFPYPFEAAGGVRPLIEPQGVQHDADVPTVLQYNFTIQQEIVRDTVFSIGYVGSSAYHILHGGEVNSAFPEFLPDGRKFFPAGAPLRNPALNNGGIRQTDGTSTYNSLQLEVDKRLSRGLRFKGAYTFSKNIDTNAGNISEEAQGGANAPQDPDDVHADRGLAAWDATHNVSFSYNYDLPLGQNVTGFARVLLGGWQLTGITSLVSGGTFTGLLGFNRSRNGVRGATGIRPDLVPGGNNNPILGSPDKWFDPSVFVVQQLGTYGNLARNTLRTDGRINFDFSIFKNTALRENMNLQLRVELFNIFNHPNFAVPDSVLFNSDATRRGAAGRVRNTTTTSRQIQVGAKFIF